jgi:hypothetical protein
MLSGVALLAALLLAAPAEAAKRVALVIGNSTYQNVNPLPNPARDAAAIADLLRQAKFDVVEASQNVRNTEMRRAIRDFSDKAADADIAVVYYAGHGIEVDGVNYLLPVDTRLERDIDVEDEAVSLDRIIRVIDPARQLRLVILDACRDNPFSRSMKRSIASRGVEKGLAKVEPTSPNTLIAYAAKAGSTASDGAGDHSPFTTALLAQLTRPGQDLRKSLGYVRDAVLKATGNKQEPFVYGSLGGDDVVLVPASGAATRPPPGLPVPQAAADPGATLRLDYELAEKVNTRAAWDAFLAAHPTGFYADLARAARAKLDTARSAAAPPATPPGPAGGGEIAAYVGKTFRLTYNERQEELDGKSPNPAREIAIFVASPTAITARITQFPNNPERRTSRWYAATPGDLDRGMQVSIDKGLHLTAMAGGSSYRLTADITVAAGKCTGRINYEKLPDRAHIELRRVGTGEVVLIKSLTAEGIGCWITPGDQVGPVPPLASAAPAAAPSPQPSPQPSSQTSSQSSAQPAGQSGPKRP